MINNMSCCGMKEIAGLQNYMIGGEGQMYRSPCLRALVQLFRPWYNNPSAYGKGVFGHHIWTPYSAHFVFTDAHEYTIPYGKVFAKYILKNRLGSLVCSRQAFNQNYRQYFPKGWSRNHVHMITCWIWTIDHERIRELLHTTVPDFWDGKEGSLSSSRNDELFWGWVGKEFPIETVKGLSFTKNRNI